MRTRIKKGVSVIFDGKVWFSGTPVSEVDEMRMLLAGYATPKILEVV